MRHIGLLIVLFAGAVMGAPPDGFVKSAHFDEREKWGAGDLGRNYTNLTPDFAADGKGLLVFFACPNGNTIEQSLGSAKLAGLDWHFDIQHIGAQMRALRGLDEKTNMSLVVLEAPKLSWPAFRQSPDADARIKQHINSFTETLKPARVALTGHSGGGSLIFGFINAHEKIPDTVERIIWLDANYSYNDDLKHGDKLLAWLKADKSHRMIVIAYDDREIMLNGKKVVGPTGGTFRATERMIARLGKDVGIKQDTVGPFTHHRAMDGQIEMFVHPNPENKILHTTLVGEMNGFLQGMTLGTELEKKWGTFGGPRAYEKFIAPLPVVMKLAATRSAAGGVFKDRQADAMTGSAFAQKIGSLPIAEREQAIAREIIAGNVPAFLRGFKLVRDNFTSADGAKHEIEYRVMCDVLAVGDDADFMRMPMTPMTAQAIADATGCMLITRKMSDAIYQQAEVKRAPKPLTKDREKVETFLQHHQIIETQRAGKAPGLLVAGIKKDVVISNRLMEKPAKVAIYGWHLIDGKPIQPLYAGHKDMYVDYSHGIRLVMRDVKVDGKVMRLDEVLADPALCGLVSDEGPIKAGLYKAMEVK